MKNIKNILLFSILVFECRSFPFVKGHFIEITKENAEAVTKMVTIGGVSLVDASKALLADGAGAFSKSNVLIAKQFVKAVGISSPAAVAASEGVGYKAMQQLAQSNTKIAESIASVGHAALACFTPLAWGVVAIYGIYQLTPIGKELFQTKSTTEEQKNTEVADVIQSAKRLKLLQVEQELRECLLNSTGECKINASGRPTACEQAAQMLAMLGGQDEVNRMTSVFKQYRK